MDNIFEGYVIISDMDGTLLNTEKQISEDNLKAIKYFCRKGGKFTLATGRMVRATKKYIDFKLSLPVILHSGAKIYDLNNNKDIWELPLDVEIKGVLQRIKKERRNIGIEIYFNEKVYVYNSCRFTKRFVENGYEYPEDVPEEVWKEKWTKVLLLGEKEELDEIETIYNDEYGFSNYLRSGQNFLDLININASKGKALNKIVELYSLDKSKVIAVGDNMNDEELIKEAGFGFCVENADKRLFSIADYIAPNNDSSPIMYIVKWLEEKIKNK
ncbi:MAG: HAD family hydrolase [Clostridiales bacterium]|nr:HAD family hydrolase [Clostridiales bacterium]